MVKADMRKGMLLKGKIGAEERIYRVLDLKEKVLVLDCVKKTMPVWKTYEELSDCVEKEEESMAEAIDIIDFRYSSFSFRGEHENRSNQKSIRKIWHFQTDGQKLFM